MAADSAAPAVAVGCGGRVTSLSSTGSLYVDLFVALI